jgi:ATP-dependent exoDNAse (exonuclease V) beta subunit
VRELVTGARSNRRRKEGEVGLTPLDHFLQKAMLVAELDKLGPDADAVTMMTLHNAKGLEFPVVFITGLEDGLFPLAKAFDDPPLLEEERRLFYVGITRAEKKLFLTHAEGRTRNGEYKQSKASSFLQAIQSRCSSSTRRSRSAARVVRSCSRSVAGVSGATHAQRGVDHPAREQWLDKESAFPPRALAASTRYARSRAHRASTKQRRRRMLRSSLSVRGEASQVRQWRHRRAGRCGA